MTNHDTITIEWAPFHLRTGVTEDQLRAASTAFQEELLARQPGFLRRELLRAQDGGYVDLVWWQTPAAAQAIMEVVGGSPAFARYCALMAGNPADGAASIQHFAHVATYAK